MQIYGRRVRAIPYDRYVEVVPVNIVPRGDVTCAPAVGLLDEAEGKILDIVLHIFGLQRRVFAHKQRLAAQRRMPGNAREKR